MRLLNSWSFIREVLKCHLVGICILLGWNCLQVNVTGAWSLMMMEWIVDLEISAKIELLRIKKSMREYNLWTGEKNEYSLDVGFWSHQPSPSPSSFIYCFIISVESRVAVVLLLLSIKGLITVLKSPPIMTGQNYWKLLKKKNMGKLRRVRIRAINICDCNWDILNWYVSDYKSSFRVTHSSIVSESDFFYW